jgi:hypothetical protein
MKIASDLEAAVLKYIAHIKADYAGWGERTAIREVMIQEFNTGVVFEIHRKFIKVMTGRSGSGSSVHHAGRRRQVQARRYPQGCFMARTCQKLCSRQRADWQV